MERTATSKASQCRICADMVVRNISIAFLQENGGWVSDSVNPFEIESRLNLAGRFKPDRTLAHRKTNFEIFHSTSTHDSLVHGESGKSVHLNSSPVDTLCESCKHLDLKRLCTQLHDYVMEITLGCIGNLHSRRECSLCAFLSESIEKTLPAIDSHDPAWAMKPVYLRFAFQETRIDVGQGVKIYLCIDEEHTLLRVYDNVNVDQTVPERKSTHDAWAPRLLPRTIDWEYFQRLAYSCVQTHPECCVVSDRAHPIGFRLIDVKQRKVVRIGVDNVPRYLALSYVWGENPDNKYLLAEENIDDFERESSLLGLPPVIEDSLEVCLQFRTRYLWVDRLCIVQDDYIHKMKQIYAMDTIYQAAELVIVAASSSNLQEGLAGVSTRRESQPALLLQSDELKIVASLPTFTDIMRPSTWQKRGWTYQEAVLGRRKLYFTSRQAFFDCGEGRFVKTEDDFAEGSTYGISLGRNRYNTLWQYYSHVDQYNRRTLRKPSDVYKAIQGITQTLYPNQPLHFGLPASDFDQALLWRGCSHYRLTIDEEIILPAWSWSSTNSVVKRWPYLFLGTLVSWSVCNRNSSGELEVVLAEAMFSPETWLDWKPEFTCQTICPQLAMAIAWSKHSIEAEEPFRQLRNDDYTIHELQKELCALWPTYEDFWNAAFGNTAMLTSQLNTDLNGTLQVGMLVGRVQLKKFPITRHEEPGAKDLNQCGNNGRLQIGRNASTQPAGMLEEPHPDLHWIQARSDSLSFAALSISEWQGDEHCFDWILKDSNRRQLSIRTGEHMDSLPPRTLWDARARWFHEEGLENLEDDRRMWHLHGTIPPERPPLLVNVMLLYHDGHTARYVCKGWMFLRVWSSQSCEFSTVAVSPKRCTE